jgi:predicted peptidase
MFRPLLLVALFGIVGCGPAAPVQIPPAAALEKLPPGVHKKTAEVPGVGSVKYAIEVPAGYDGSTPTPLVLALHYGYNGNTPDPYTGLGMIDDFRSGLAGLSAIVIAPDCLGGDWTDARNEQAAVWLVQSACQTYAVDPKRIVITGYSMGGAGTWFIGSRHQDLFTGAIPVAAPVAESTEWKIPVYAIHSQDDEIVSYSAAKRHASAIQSQGGKFEFKTVSRLTHYDSPAYAPHVGDGVKWLQEQWK